MPLIYLAVAVALMFGGGMLIALNPEPLAFQVGAGGQIWLVRASILEIFGGAVLTGAVAVGLLTLRGGWRAARERRVALAAAAQARDEATALRREAADARSQAALLGAQLAEVREAYLALEVEARPLLTMRREAVAEAAAEAAAAAAAAAPPASEPTPAPEPAPAAAEPLVVRPAPVSKRWRGKSRRRRG